MNIHRVHSGAYLQCNSWFIDGPSAGILVDPGSGCEEQKLLDRLTNLGFSRDRITHVLITHCHCDHALGATRWQTGGATIVASRRTAGYLASGHPFIWGEHPDLVPKIHADLQLKDDQTFSAGGVSIQGIHTPGHTPGSMTYFIGHKLQRVAFTGDLLLGDGNPGWARTGHYDEEQLLENLERLLEYKIDRIYPGHGAPINDVDDWLRKGLKKGRSGQWNPTCEWQSWEVPEELKR